MSYRGKVHMQECLKRVLLYSEVSLRDNEFEHQTTGNNKWMKFNITTTKPVLNYTVATLGIP
jgi:hypothetical protein